MSRPTGTVTLAALPSASTPVFTAEQDCFLFFYMTIMRVDRRRLTRLFNAYFRTSVTESMIASAARRLSYRIGAYSYERYCTVDQLLSRTLTE